MPDLTWWEAFNLWALAAFVVLWVFALGANLGSFLNVVVYRLPRGMPLALSISRCPKCANPIAFRDNIPILSWLLLRGRCRSCGQAISARYPLVEATVGGLFVLLFYVELVSGGANLPGPHTRHAGLIWLITDPPWDLAVITCCHCCLLYLLLGIALIQADRRPLPWKLAAAGVVLGMPAAWIQVVPMTANWPAWLASCSISQAVLTGLAGIAIGTAWGVLHLYLKLPLAWPAMIGSRRHVRASQAVVIASALVGLYLGWQAATVVGLTAALLRLMAAGLGRFWLALRRVPSSAHVALAALGQILCWKWTAQFLAWPGLDAAVLALAAIASMAAVLVLLLGRSTSFAVADERR